MRRKKEASYRPTAFSDEVAPRERSLVDKSSLDPWSTPSDGLPSHRLKPARYFRGRKKANRTQRGGVRVISE